MEIILAPRREKGYNIRTLRSGSNILEVNSHCTTANYISMNAGYSY